MEDEIIKKLAENMTEEELESVSKFMRICANHETVEIGPADMEAVFKFISIIGRDEYMKVADEVFTKLES